MTDSKARASAGAAWLAGVLGLGAALRLFHLGTESFYLDEGYSIRVARQGLTAVLDSAAVDVHPPLYYEILSLWVRAFGASEFAARLPSAIFGWLSLVMLERLGSRLFGRSVGLAAAAIAAVSVFAIHYSQEARSYALLALLSLISIDAYAGPPAPWTRWRSLRYVLSSAALLYTDNFGVFVIAAQNLHFVVGIFRTRVDRAARIRSWIVLQAAIALSFAPWSAAFSGQLHNVRAGFWLSRPTLLSLVRTALEFGGSIPLLAVEGALALISLATLLRGADRSPSAAGDGRGLLVVLWIAAPVLLPFGVSLVVAPIYLTRAAIPAAFGCYLCVAHGLRCLGRTAAGLAVIGALSVPALMGYYGAVHKEPWRDAVAEIERLAKPGDLVLVHAAFNRRNVYDYYARRRDLDILGFPAAGGAVDEAAIAPLGGLSRSHERIWLVLSRPDDPRGLIPRTLARSHRLDYARTYRTRAYAAFRTRAFVGIEVFLYRR